MNSAELVAYRKRLTREQKDDLLTYLMGWLDGTGMLSRALAGAGACGLIPPAES